MKWQSLSKLKTGDQVAVVSPSAGLPGLFPWVQDLGLERLRDVFELQPIEYPTTRQMGSSLEDRAKDLTSAFSDPANKAVFTSIGGQDQVRLIKLLDPKVFKDNPKPFFGFSDNTHLHNFLWNLGIPSYYGDAVMTQLAMQVRMHKLTKEFLHHALFDRGEFELTAATSYTDEGLDWSDPKNLQKKRKEEPNEGWYWDGDKDASGILWGGCAEALVVQMATEKYLPKPEKLKGTILYLETAEDIPEHWIVEYLLTGMGERGWLDIFQAVVVGRPKAWEFDTPNNAAEKKLYKDGQRETVLQTIRFYNSDILVVQNLDFGHTDPQVPLPSGGKMRLESGKKKIFIEY